MAEANPKEQKETGPVANTVEEFRYIQQVYQNQYMALAQEMNARASALQELDRAQKALENLEMIKERPSLVPIGSDTYATGKITDSDSVVVGIGAGYLVEKKLDDAKNFISKAIEGETQQINKLNKSKKEIEAALIEISYKVEELSHRV